MPRVPEADIAAGGRIARLRIRAPFRRSQPVSLLLLLLVAQAAVAQDKPNIVLVFLDNFGWGEPGFNGGGIVRVAGSGQRNCRCK